MFFFFGLSLGVCDGGGWSVFWAELVCCFSFSFALDGFGHVLKDGYDGVFMSATKSVYAVCNVFETQRSIAEDSDEEGFNLLGCGRLSGAWR